MSQPARATTADWGPYVDAMTQLHGLSLDTARRQEVMRQLAHLEVMARRFVDFPLDPAVEIAPVFQP